MGGSVPDVRTLNIREQAKLTSTLTTIYVQNVCRERDDETQQGTNRKQLPSVRYLLIGVYLIHTQHVANQ